MRASELQARADRFRRLHEERRLFILPTAWDAVSARLFETASFPAVATTSAGIALAHGRPDGERLSRDEMLAVVRSIAGSVAVPVSADIESGYAAEPSGVGDTARQAIEAGAVGINIEDGDRSDRSLLIPVETAAARIAAARAAADTAGVRLLINARVDIYLRSTGDPEADFETAVTRGRAYVAAGADCVFAIGARDLAAIRLLARAIPAPLNVLATPGIPSLPELEAAGVTRLSLGPGPMLATLGLLRRIGTELRERGSYAPLFEGALTYPEANGLFPREPA